MTEGSFHRRRSSAVWLVGAVLALAVGGGAWLWYDGSLPGTTTPAQAQTAAPPPPPVTVSQPLRRELVEWDEFTGQFAAVDYVEIRARVSGYLHDPFRGRADRQKGRSAVRDRSAALRGDAGRRPGAARPGQCAGRARQPAARARRSAPPARCARPAPMTSGVSDLKVAAAAVEVRQGRDPLGRAQCRVHPDHRAADRPHQQASGQRRQPDQRRRRQRPDPA